MGRRAAREIAMKLLYQFDIQKENKREQFEYIISQNKVTNNDVKYLLDITEGVETYFQTLNEIIEKHIKGWTISRLSKVDLAILRLSTYEIKYRDDIPISVSINEAVELAKELGSDKAYAFVNAVMGKIYNNQISKSGEGDVKFEIKGRGDTL